ncbi:hypothetical protein RUND412_001729 [Rhizina undulata]
MDRDREERDRRDRSPPSPSPSPTLPSILLPSTTAAPPIHFVTFVTFVISHLDGASIPTLQLFVDVALALPPQGVIATSLDIVADDLAHQSSLALAELWEDLVVPRDIEITSCTKGQVLLTLSNASWWRRKRSQSALARPFKVERLSVQTTTLAFSVSADSGRSFS